MAPPPPTLAKFAGFVEWSHQQRAQGRGVCFGIVPDGMTAAVGILQVRLDPALAEAKWGFVLSAHFWSTGVFADSANVVVDFAFTTLHVEHLEARIALRNRRAHAALQKLGARFESTRGGGVTTELSARSGVGVDAAGTRSGGTGCARLGRQPTMRQNGSGQQSKRRKASYGGATRLRQSNRIRCSCLTAGDGNDAQALTAA